MSYKTKIRFTFHHQHDIMYLCNGYVTGMCVSMRVVKAVLESSGTVEYTRYILFRLFVDQV